MPKQALPEITVDVMPRVIISAYLSAPFDQAQEALEAADFRIISLQENADLRMQEGKSSDVSTNGNYTREGVLYIPKKGNFLVRNSPILYSAGEATEAHRQGREFYPTQEAIEKALQDQDSIEVPMGDIKIPTNRFGEEGLTAWAFGDIAEDYGAFLGEAGIKQMPVYLLNKDYVINQEKPFVRQLWFGSLGCRSGPDGDAGDLDYCGRVRGVPEKTGEASAKKIEAYTPEQVATILKDLKLSGLEAQVLSELRKQKH